MKRVKRGLISTEDIISKSEYARKIGVTPPAVDKMVNNGYLTIVKFPGGEVIYQG